MILLRGLSASLSPSQGCGCSSSAIMQMRKQSCVTGRVRDCCSLHTWRSIESSVSRCLYQIGLSLTIITICTATNAAVQYAKLLCFIHLPRYAAHHTTAEQRHSNSVLRCQY